MVDQLSARRSAGRSKFTRQLRDKRESMESEGVTALGKQLARLTEGRRFGERESIGSREST
jgi:hypothetical protein